VRCADSREALRKAAQAVAADELIWRDLDVIEHMDYAVTLGVLTLPAVECIQSALIRFEDRLRFALRCFLSGFHTGAATVRCARLPMLLTIQCRKS